MAGWTDAANLQFSLVQVFFVHIYIYFQPIPYYYHDSIHEKRSVLHDCDHNDYKYKKELTEQAN